MDKSVFEKNKAAKATSANAGVNGTESAQGSDVALALVSSVGGQIEGISGALQQTAFGAGPAIDQLADVATQMLNGEWAMNRFTQRIATNLEAKGTVSMPEASDAFTVNVEPIKLDGTRDRFLGLFGLNQKALPNPLSTSVEDAD